ncbi:MAG: DUF2062 domain-containing protein [Thiocapsa sp.]|nr:DUF2062 domain-containing protein [Thiocapsa sp.]MCG6897336.1 DUF2062 domain-containing protein [Thiocapsa sp.]MCG6984424.1 DUF2062 domain-containing protein [Thiocapsa sp.]
MKRWLKRILPAPGVILANRQLGVFGKLLHDPNLWHLNRHSVSGAVAVGLFVAFLPPLGQSLVAAGAAIFFRVNLPIAVLTTWVSNPVTIPPMFYFAYSLGCWLVGIEPRGFKLDFWMDWHNWLAVMWPLALGSLVCAAVSATLGYLMIQMLWRWRLTRLIRARQARYRATASRDSRPSSKRQV